MNPKILLIASIAIFISTLKISAQVVTTQPITAVSFPKEVVPVDAGSIEFDARMTGFSGYIPWGGVEPHFFEISDGTSTYHIGFNGNDGVSNGGLVGMVGNYFTCGTGLYGTWYFEDIYEAGEVDQWHHYKFAWDKDGLSQGNSTRKVDIYIDDVLNSSHWERVSPKTILQPTDGTFNLITCDNISDLPGVVAIDELKIYDGDGNLVLYNKLGSKHEIENSEVGLNGSFHGFGDAHFVSGTDGNAVEANPVLGLGTGVSSCNAPTGLNAINITATTAKLKWDAVAEALRYKLRYKITGSGTWTTITNISSTSKTISGLAPNTSYTCEVKSVCSANPIVASEWSSPQSFTTISGGDQYFTVPEGVTQITVKLWGAGGAGGNYAPCVDIGGGGGFVTGTIPVTPGEILTIVEGGKGETGAGPGSYGGGGGKQNGVGGRGGGRSAVVRDGDDIITAGSGGGGGGCAFLEGAWTDAGGGGGGGVEGNEIQWVSCNCNGRPGTDSHPGDGGHSGAPQNFCTCGSNPGDGHNGGYAGAYDNGYHGSGGGGYFGGGSGTDLGDGGGGGGSGLVPSGGYSEQGNTLGLRIPGGTSDPDYPGNNIGYGGAKGQNGNNGAVVIVGYWPVLKLSESNVSTVLQIDPNPAEGYTTIHFTLQQSSHMSIVVYDLNGRAIQTLVNDELQQGDHSIPLNTDHFSKGVYLVKMISDFGMENQKLIVQ